MTLPSPSRFSPECIARRLRARLLIDYAKFIVMAVSFFAFYWFIGGAA